jgi:WhiB family redox-sensing transcriptional regulator
MSWWTRAACNDPTVDPDVFYPEKGGKTEPAKRVCRRCPVTAECLDFALATDQRFGVFGGLSERERRKLKRRQRVA